MLLQGFVTYTGAPPATAWTLYSGPGTVSFSNPAQTNSLATFSAPGTYTLMLSADDRVHAVAYAAVNLTVTQTISLAIASLGTNVSLRWSGGSPPFIVERSDAIAPSTWIPVLTNNASSAVLPAPSPAAYFRLSCH